MEVDDIIIRAVSGEPEAFVTVMHSFLQKMYKSARLLLKNEEDVADAIQETILTAWEKIGTLQYPQYFQTWVMKILVNKCYDLLRNQTETIDIEQLETGRQDSKYEEIEWESLLQLLPEKYRIVLVLYYAEGFRTKDGLKTTDVMPTIKIDGENMYANYEEKLRSEVDLIVEISGSGDMLSFEISLSTLRPDEEGYISRGEELSVDVIKLQ